MLWTQIQLYTTERQYEHSGNATATVLPINQETGTRSKMSKFLGPLSINHPLPSRSPPSSHFSFLIYAECIQLHSSPVRKIHKGIYTNSATTRTLNLGRIKTLLLLLGGCFRSLHQTYTLKTINDTRLQQQQCSCSYRKWKEKDKSHTKERYRHMLLEKAIQEWDSSIYIVLHTFSWLLKKTPIEVRHYLWVNTKLSVSG